MSLSLINILIFEALLVMGCMTGWLLGLAIQLFFPEFDPKDLSLVGGILAIFGLTWRIHERYHFRPLCFPRCSHCKRRPDAWGVAWDAWPRIGIVCLACGSPVELWMTRRVDPNDVSEAVPSFRLLWPEFIGMWKRL